MFTSCFISILFIFIFLSPILTSFIYVFPLVFADRTLGTPQFLNLVTIHPSLTLVQLITTLAHLPIQNLR
jgi:hypothetical protein